MTSRFSILNGPIKNGLVFGKGTVPGRASRRILSESRSRPSAAFKRTAGSCWCAAIGSEKSEQTEAESVKWSSATVVENKAVSMDGAMRVLVVSIEDKVVFLEGRSMAPKQQNPRWGDAYQVPGQFVRINVLPTEAQDVSSAQQASSQREHLLPIVNSPYAVRRDSADLDASLIEILVDSQKKDQGQDLAELGPGSLLEVSEVFGRGYSSLFNSYVGLLSALEESRPLLLIGYGARGVGPLRAVIEWTPIQAHSTAHRVTFLYVASSPLSAAFLKDWDSWREAGVNVVPIYLQNNSAVKETIEGPLPPMHEPSSQQIQEVILKALQEETYARNESGINLSEAALLISGIPGEATAGITRELTKKGLSRERVLFCDYF